MLVFIDETGNSNLSAENPEYPIFCLGALVIEESEYEKLSNNVNNLKKQSFGDSDTFILHSSDLKRPNDPKVDPRNMVMCDPAVRASFYKAFDEKVIKAHTFSISAYLIDKASMYKKYSYPVDIYYFCFEKILNGMLSLDSNPYKIRAETRGEISDFNLMGEYESIKILGTASFEGSEIQVRTSLTIALKKENDIGIQVIDLALSSLVRSLLGKAEKMTGNDLNPAYITEKTTFLQESGS